METGTGKTYVYLRTIYELAERYGWLKFIIVVPSVAIREGVKENLRITAEHFRSLYHQTARVQVYEGKRVQELKEFAQSNPRRQEQIDSPEFKELWSRISARTRYRVEFDTEELIRKAVDAMKRIPEIRLVEVRFTTAATTLQKAGVAATPESQSHQELRYKGPLPDLLAYLQAQTDLTRSTLQRVLKTSGRLEEFLINPQDFMDATVGALRTAMLELLIDGIQYERIPETEPDHVWQQEQIFEALTKGNRNYQKMRTLEAYKARCGHKHFAALGVSFDVVDKVEQV